MPTDDRPAARRPSLHVLSADAVDVVSSAGGLIFDRVRLGWRVTVLIPDGGPTRAIRILGAEMAELHHATDPAAEPCTALAVSAHLYDDDRLVRLDVDAASNSKTTEVLVWGQPTGLEHDDRLVAHRLTSAARAFKRQALLALELDSDPPEPTEQFHPRCGLDVLARELDVAG